MKEKAINEFKSLISNSDNKFLQILYKYIDENGEYRLVPPIVLPRETTLNIYKTRYEIQMNVTHASIIGYEDLLTQIEESKTLEVLIVGIYTKCGFYACFFELLTKKVLGVLLNKEKDMIDK